MFFRRSRGSAHVFAHNGDDRDIRIHGDVLNLVVRQVLRKLFAKASTVR